MGRQGSATHDLAYTPSYFFAYLHFVYVEEGHEEIAICSRIDLWYRPTFL